MLKGTQDEVMVAIGILRRLRLRDPQADIWVHDVARHLEMLVRGLQDGEPVTEQLAVSFASPTMPAQVTSALGMTKGNL